MTLFVFWHTSVRPTYWLKSINLQWKINAFFQKRFTSGVDQDYRLNQMALAHFSRGAITIQSESILGMEWRKNTRFHELLSRPKSNQIFIACWRWIGRQWRASTGSQTPWSWSTGDPGIWCCNSLCCNWDSSRHFCCRIPILSRWRHWHRIVWIRRYF